MLLNLQEYDSGRNSSAIEDIKKIVLLQTASCKKKKLWNLAFWVNEI